MEFIDAIILGVVEGITEFFPISSTGHLILTAELLGLPETDFLKTFQIAIQLGAILAIVALYWRKLLFDRAIIKRVIIALLPALGVGFVFYSLASCWNRAWWWCGRCLSAVSSLSCMNGYGNQERMRGRPWRR